MKSRSTKANTGIRKSTTAGLLLIIVAALTLEATSLLQNYFSRKGLMEEAQLRAESLLETTRLQIADASHQAESAVRNSIWIAQWCLDYPDSLPRVPSRIVEDNPSVMGSTIALVPNYSRKRPLYSPYACREGDSIALKSLATAEYDYPSKEWFTSPLELNEGYWSEPYLDIGGGNALMTTYSVPIHDNKGKAAAVLTADISLAWLSQIARSSMTYPNSYELVVSRGGSALVCPSNDEPLMWSNIEDLKDMIADTKSFDVLATAVKAGESGTLPLRINGKVNQVFFSPVDLAGWTAAIAIPEDEIYRDIRRVQWIERLFQLLGLGMLFLILRVSAKNQMKYQKMNEKKELMENELMIGRNIQMSMIPNIFPPFPERNDIELSACLIPAKEVGGDLYDFYIRDEKLFFCIGDVSGKGVPASLVMAVTRSLFRTVSAHEKSPQRIVTAMNDSMADMNESNMFVTFFCGILDLATGHLRYCNAGHNPPFVVSDEVRALDVLPNLPMGVMPKMSFQEQETDLKYDDTLFLFTDGLNEAENAAFEQFTEQRLENILKERRNSNGHLEAMKQAVSDFVGEAPQSDDLTMLVIHYMNNSTPSSSERHLVLHNDIQQIPQLADFVETIATEKNLDQGLAMSLNLALEEAVTNVIQYAYPEGSDGLVDIEAIIRDKQLDFIISDSGKAFDPTAKAEVDINMGVEERPIGGLGIHLVKHIMDSVTYRREDGKNILTMIKKI
ncbi:MAG: SpoIIE family protein phosphatase [Bacteroidales bacterium]|nr:SpoIIE family protein phosphatase [Bacteroidales bacterium]